MNGAYYMGRYSEANDWFEDGFFQSLKQFLIVVVGCAFAPIAMIFGAIELLWKWFNGQTQFMFFVKFYILRMGFTLEQIDAISWATKVKNTNSFAHKTWRLCAKLANKRFNKTKF